MHNEVKIFEYFENLIFLKKTNFSFYKNVSPKKGKIGNVIYIYLLIL